ncbi:hypothetical protein NDU88_002250 [Pleurodeles waltl]|uniref:Secreted protein n=1 Tax=Pleurodeles waltl TaxID=8319 RepID=A0AAV7UX29_PLEWA|nr:hypothetical protein NDU88_002250 [Pleurodeles waltl]
MRARRAIQLYLTVWNNESSRCLTALLWRVIPARHSAHRYLTVYTLLTCRCLTVPRYARTVPPLTDIALLRFPLLAHCFNSRCSLQATVIIFYRWFR